MKRYTGMVRFYINVENTPDPTTLILKKETDGGVVTLFLSFCMHATGIWRLYDKERIQEFLYRLGVIFKTYGIIPKFFTNDSLVVFEKGKTKTEFNLNDIIDHLGMEISDSKNDFIPRDAWLEKIGDYWRQACIGAAFSGAPMLDKVIIGKNKYKIASNKPKAPDEEYKKVIDLFVQEAMKTIGEEPLKDLSERVSGQRDLLDEFVKFSKTKPLHEFKYSSIPLDIKKVFFKQIFGAPWSKYKKDFEEVVNDEDSYLCSLIHLAWLWINGYIVIHDVKMGDRISHYADVDIRMPFDYDNYDGLNKLGFGINLYDTYMDYQLDRIAHLLKEEQK